MDSLGKPFGTLPTSRYCKYTPIFVPLQPILNIQTKMRLRYAYVSVLLLISFSTIANVWASSSLSLDGRAFSYAVSSDTVGRVVPCQRAMATLWKRKKKIPSLRRSTSAKWWLLLP